MFIHWALLIYLIALYIFISCPLTLVTVLAGIFLGICVCPSGHLATRISCCCYGNMRVSGPTAIGWSTKWTVNDTSSTSSQLSERTSTMRNMLVTNTEMIDQILITCIHNYYGKIVIFNMNYVRFLLVISLCRLWLNSCALWVYKIDPFVHSIWDRNLVYLYHP